VSRAGRAAGLALLAGAVLSAACAKPKGGAATPAVSPAPAAASSGAPAPGALAAWWDAHHVAFPTAPIITHADVMTAATRAVAADAGRLSRETIGRSVEGRELTHLAIGRGPMHVLLWSQMHGDEPSATPAIFDVLEWLRRERDSDPRAGRIAERLTVHVVPMLNPDGAERFVRRNAQGIDINRDALHLQTPEGRALKALRDRLEPVLGFNLHNQNGQTSAGSPPRPATISLLAVAHDAARSDSPRRTLAKQTAAIVREALEPLIPGQVGRYSDEFEPRAFGDNLGRWGTAVVLIESGPLQGADAEARLVRLNFVGLLTALDALASGRASGHSTTAYDLLPVNESNLLRLRVRNATIVSGAGIPPFTGDIGINTSRAIAVRDGVRTVVVTPRIADLGDLSVYGTLEDVDATGLTATPAFDARAREGELVRLPDWRSWKGATLSVGQPGAVFLLAPADLPADGSSGSWRLVRRIEPGAPVP
jgi:zinc carboxypeptidase